MLRYPTKFDVLRRERDPIIWPIFFGGGKEYRFNIIGYSEFSDKPDCRAGIGWPEGTIGRTYEDSVSVYLSFVSRTSKEVKIDSEMAGKKIQLPPDFLEYGVNVEPDISLTTLGSNSVYITKIRTSNIFTQTIAPDAKRAEGCSLEETLEFLTDLALRNEFILNQESDLLTEGLLELLPYTE